MAHDPYNAETIADDLGRYSEDIFLADISDTFETTTHGGGHAYLMDTPIGRRFKVTVAEIGQADDGLTWADKCSTEDPCPVRATHGGLSCNHS